MSIPKQIPTAIDGTSGSKYLEKLNTNKNARTNTTDSAKTQQILSNTSVAVTRSLFEKKEDAQESTNAKGHSLNSGKLETSHSAPPELQRRHSFSHIPPVPPPPPPRTALVNALDLDGHQKKISAQPNPDKNQTIVQIAENQSVAGRSSSSAAASSQLNFDAIQKSLKSRAEGGESSQAILQNLKQQLLADGYSPNNIAIDGNLKRDSNNAFLIEPYVHPDSGKICYAIEVTYLVFAKRQENPLRDPGMLSFNRTISTDATNPEDAIVLAQQFLETVCDHAQNSDSSDRYNQAAMQTRTFSFAFARNQLGQLDALSEISIPSDSKPSSGDPAQLKRAIPPQEKRERYYYDETEKKIKTIASSSAVVSATLYTNRALCEAREKGYAIAKKAPATDPYANEPYFASLLKQGKEKIFEFKAQKNAFAKLIAGDENGDIESENFQNQLATKAATAKNEILKQLVPLYRLSLELVALSDDMKANSPQDSATKALAEEDQNATVEDMRKFQEQYLEEFKKASQYFYELLKATS